MNDELTAFLSRHTSHCEETIFWGELQLQVNTYLCTDLPPLPFITSVRTVLLHEDTVLVVRDPVSYHILPGGRIESGEALLETLGREVLEETGWTLQASHYLGIKHFHHLTPRPQDYAYPYPDFLQAIYVSRAGEFRAEARETGGYELDATFQPLEAVQRLTLSPNEQLYLEAGLKHMAQES